MKKTQQVLKKCPEEKEGGNLGRKKMRRVVLWYTCPHSNNHNKGMEGL